LVATAVFLATSDATPRTEPAALVPGTAAPAVTADPAAPTPTPPPVLPRFGLAQTKRPTVVRVVPSRLGEIMSFLRAGILLPIRAETNGFLRIETPCELDGWISRKDVVFDAPGAQHVTSLRDATIVIDPGHGGLDLGAVGPKGLQEKAVNLDISRRLAALLAPARVLLTRDADYTAGLQYRTDIASSVGAQMLVSVHNNSSPDIHTDIPGTETFYQLHSASSRRLAGLTYEELLHALIGFKVPWVAERDAGAKYRMNERGGDYYHVLRTSRPPAVIVEGLYISNPPEEALLARADVRDIMAQALARAIGRYLTTNDPGSGFVDKPLPRASGPVYLTPSKCRDPS
jgi:N-acetylmuramoyl-L-alanine amidase